jgi:hypothetical protein
VITLHDFELTSYEVNKDHEIELRRPLIEEDLRDAQLVVPFNIALAKGTSQLLITSSGLFSSAIFRI